MPRRIFGPKREEVTTEWRKIHNEELTVCTLTEYYSCHQIEKNEKGGACSTHGGEIHTEFRLGNFRERGNLKEPGLEERQY